MMRGLAALGGLYVALVLVLAACGGGGDGARPTPRPSPITSQLSPTPELTPAPTTAPTPAPSILDQPKLIFIRQLATAYPVEGVLWMSDLDGANPRQLTPGNEDATFAGLVEGESGSPLFYYVTRDEDTARTLWSLNLDDGQRSVVLEYRGRDHRLGAASVTSNGRYVAFSYVDGIDLLDLVTGERQQIIASNWAACETGPPDCFGYDFPRWSPDDRLLLTLKGFWEGGAPIVLDPFEQPPQELLEASIGDPLPISGVWATTSDAFCGYGRYAATSGLYVATAPEWRMNNLLPEYEENTFSPEGYSERTVQSCSWLDDARIAVSVEISEYPGTSPNIPERSAEILVLDTDIGEARFLAAAPASFNALDLVATPEGVIVNLFDGSLDFPGDEPQTGQPQRVDVDDGTATPILEEGDWVVAVVEP